jgi:hypothetical protein
MWNETAFNQQNLNTPCVFPIKIPSKDTGYMGQNLNLRPPNYKVEEIDYDNWLKK